jgi:hypothetical protein
LPSKEELISKLLFVINAQAQRIVTVINAVPRNWQSSSNKSVMRNPPDKRRNRKLKRANRRRLKLHRRNTAETGSDQAAEVEAPTGRRTKRENRRLSQDEAAPEAAQE